MSALIVVIIGAFIFAFIYLYVEKTPQIIPTPSNVKFKISENNGIMCLTNDGNIVSKRCNSVDREWASVGEQLLHVPSGGCLTLTGNNTVGLTQCVGASSQLWGRLNNTNDRHLRVKSTGQCLTSGGGSFYMAACSDNPYQSFTMRI